MPHRLLDAARDLLGELVAYDTVSDRSNVACAQLLADRLERSGWQVELFYDCSMGQAKASLLARSGPAEDGGLILSGHMDVVPWDDQPGWSRDALRLGRVGDRLVGRGVADMKGFLAQCVSVAETLDHRRLRRPLALLFTCDEEVGCLGAQRQLPQLERLRREQPLPADCLIGEPSDFRVYRAHKGHVRFTLTTRGRGGHSSRPDLGASAITAAAAAALAITCQALSWTRSSHHPLNPPQSRFRWAWHLSFGSSVPAEHAIRGLDGVTLVHADRAATETLLVDGMGLRKVAIDGRRVRFVSGDGGSGAYVDLLLDPDAGRGRVARGSVHHVAFRVADDDAQAEWQQRLLRSGHPTTEVKDRMYFHSVYFREPGGVLFELATDNPGFATDESVGKLGSGLRLPPWLESRRDRIERALPALEDPEGSKPGEAA